MPETEQEISPSLLKLWVLYTDGASNTSGSGLGLVLEVPTSEVIRQSIWCPDMTNNEAEYEAIIAGLRLALKYGARRVVIRCDSQLVVNQVTGTFQIKEQRLQNTRREYSHQTKGSQNASNAADQKQVHSPRYANRKLSHSYGGTSNVASVSPKKLAMTMDPNSSGKRPLNSSRNGTSSKYYPRHITLQAMAKPNPPTKQF
uniref:Uncharacterized protein Mb2253c-like n=1 Tax=Nicotiana tabacum TaxID=4097 RepID=A0A1S3ZUH1_TOBAC|nr:PREDICTED: uncharacterized protein Mb2253c-like [Nicotiana tabacum]